MAVEESGTEEEGKETTRKGQTRKAAQESKIDSFFIGILVREGRAPRRTLVEATCEKKKMSTKTGRGNGKGGGSRFFLHADHVALSFQRRQTNLS